MRPRSSLDVSLDYFSSNLDLVKKLCPNNEIMFMVKANAYGHGMCKMTEYAYYQNQIRSFGVASLGEALKIRKTYNEYNFDLYVFSDLSLIDSFDKYIDYKILPVISHMDDLDFFLKKTELKNCPLVLKFNTGMNRLGLHYNDCELVAQKISSYKRSVFHLMTHFSDSYLPKKEKTKLQYERFKEIKSLFKGKGISLEHTSVANSGAIENGVGLAETMVRPGLMVYGPQSTMSGANKWNGKIISELKIEILDIKELKKGDAVGYGSTPLDSDGTVLILGGGYGDGLFNYYQKLNLDSVYGSGKIVGRINMDMIQFLIPKIQGKIKRGDLLSLWSKEQSSIEHICEHTKMIPYEIFCALSERIPRKYVNVR